MLIVPSLSSKSCSWIPIWLFRVPIVDISDYCSMSKPILNTDSQSKIYVGDKEIGHPEEALGHEGLKEP